MNIKCLLIVSKFIDPKTEWFIKQVTHHVTSYITCLINKSCLSHGLTSEEKKNLYSKSLEG